MEIKRERPKVVLFHPHYQAGHYLTNQRQPLDILSVSGFPDQKGYEVVIIDALVMKDYRDRVFRECADALCFGTTSIFGFGGYHSSQMTKEVKAKYPSLPIISGGWFPSIEPRMFLNSGGADIVVTRQGEVTFMELLEAIRSKSSLDGIEGLVYKVDGEIVSTPPRKIEDLNKMPPMPYHLIDFQDYFDSDLHNRAKRFLYIATGKDFSSTKIRSLDYFSSYGCPCNCKFCSSPTLLARRWTALEAARVVDELDHLVKIYHFNFLRFVDANWGVSEKRVFDFCEGLLRRGVKIYWAAAVEAHVLNKYDKEVVDLMAKSGCIRVVIGAEAAHLETLKQIGKRIEPGEIYQSCEICCERGIVPTVDFIVGYPGENEKSISATIKQSCDITYRWPQIDILLALFTPLPGTPLYKRAVDLGFKPATSLNDWSEYGNWQTEIFSSIPAWKNKTFRRCQPFAISNITEKQVKTIQRCYRYYFWFGSGRLQTPKKLNLFERFLHSTSRFRLKYKWFGFPIEYKVYNILGRMLNSLRLT